jgi:hypothetical protein
MPQRPELDVCWPVGEALRQRIVPLADYIEARKGFSSDAELAAVIGVAPEQLVRWKRGGGVAPESERLMRDLAVVVADLLEVYRPHAIPEWLQGCPPGRDEVSARLASRGQPRRGAEPDQRLGERRVFVKGPRPRGTSGRRNANQPRPERFRAGLVSSSSVDGQNALMSRMALNTSSGSGRMARSTCGA